MHLQDQDTSLSPAMKIDKTNEVLKRHEGNKLIRCKRFVTHVQGGSACVHRDI